MTYYRGKWRVVLAVTLLVLSSFPFLSYPPAAAFTNSSGPNIDALVVRQMPQFGTEKQLNAIKEDQIDLIPVINSGEASELGSENNIRVLESPGSMVAYVFFNMRRSPCDDQEFRAALARIVNREYVCQTLEKDAVSPLLTFVSQISGEWVNNDAVAPDFNSVEATKILDDSGYVFDSETRWRINPNTGKILEITIVTPNRSEASILWDTGYAINYYANAMGIRSTHLSLPMGQFLARTMQGRDFDVCVQYVPLERIPFGLYVMLDSSRDINGTSAYSGAHDEALDSDLKRLWAGISESEVRQAALDAQTRLSTLLPCVPMCSIPTLSALRSEWAESVSVPNLGVDNLWTYLSIHPVTQPYGETLTKSVLGNITTLNPCLANSSIDWGVLQLIYSPLLYTDPATGKDVPILAESWSTETWTTSQGVSGMKITFNLRNDVRWQDGESFTSKDIKFCIEYLKNNNVSRYKTITEKIENVETPDDLTVIVYMNEPGYRLLYSLNWLTFMPEHIWKDVVDYTQYKPWSQDNPDTLGLTLQVGQGPFILKKTNLEGDITLYWNPIYFMKNTEKPGLVKKDATPTTAKVGEKITLSYLVGNYTGSPLRDTNANFTLSVKREDQSTALTQRATSQDGKYVAQFDSTNLSPGDYICVFSAIPFGSTSSQLVIQKQGLPTNTTQQTNTTKPTTPSSGVPGHPIEAIALGILFAVVSLIIIKKTHPVSTIKKGVRARV